MNNYSKRIQLYKDCLTVLNMFNSPNEEVLKENVNIQSHRKAIEDVLLEINAIEVGPICYKSNERTIRFKYNLYFENKITNLEATIQRDECLERSTRSAEESALAAKESVIASNRSADSAEKANELSSKSIKKATLANWLSIIAIVVSVIALVPESIKTSLICWLIGLF